MPNWCDNILRLKGSQEDVERFYEENTVNVDKKDGIKKRALSFAASVPADGKIDVAELRKRNPDMKVFPDWYLQQSDAWGCKWDVSADDCTISKDCTRYSFRTPWCPPHAWLRTIGMFYPTLKFSLDYDEPMMELTGTLRVEGNSIEDIFDVPEEKKVVTKSE